MASSISISPRPLLLEAGETGEVTITYVADLPGQDPWIWTRLNAEDWERKPIRSSDITGTTDPSERGTFKFTLNPGDSFQLIMYNTEDADPNAHEYDPYPPVARNWVMAILVNRPTNLIDEGVEPFPSGTAVNWKPWTRTPTRALLEVSKAAPEVNMLPGGVEFRYFNQSIGVDRLSGLSQDHNLEVASQDILPGNHYHVLLLVYTEDGEWDQRYMPVQTWLRTVKIEMEYFWIVNDGSAGHNTANFRLWVLEGNHYAAAGATPDVEITDRPSPGEEAMEYVDLTRWIPMPFILGPKVIEVDDPHRANRDIAILTRGIAKDAGGTDDASGNYLPGPTDPNDPNHFYGTIINDAHLYFPVGRDQEELEDQYFETAADSLDGEEFAYHVQGKYSVTYEPA